MVIDTSIFIEFLRARDKSRTSLYQLPENTNFYFSSVTVFELYAGATSKSRKNDIELMTNGLTELPFSRRTAMKAAEVYNHLKKINQLIEFRDIFIGCTALEHQMPILTLNEKHFSRIPGLVVT